MKILIVDDEPEIVSYLSFVLEKQNVTVHGASNPFDAIDAAENEQFDAIITDFKMPKMNGLEMIARIKAGPLNHQTPIIVLSGNLTNDLLDRLQRIGIIDVMSKPPEIDILLRIVEKTRKKSSKNAKSNYGQPVQDIFLKAFDQVLKTHLGPVIQEIPVKVDSMDSLPVEFSGVVTLVGRRWSGALSVSYQAGFTKAFATSLLGKDPTPSELEIFESTAGELAEQIAHLVSPKLSEQLGIHLISTPPVVIPGRRLNLPVLASQPRVALEMALSGKKCYLEYALVDMLTIFNGKVDSENVELMSLD